MLQDNYSNDPMLPEIKQEGTNNLIKYKCDICLYSSL